MPEARSSPSALRSRMETGSCCRGCAAERPMSLPVAVEVLRDGRDQQEAQQQHSAINF